MDSSNIGNGPGQMAQPKLKEKGKLLTGNKDLSFEIQTLNVLGLKYPMGIDQLPIQSCGQDLAKSVEPGNELYPRDPTSREFEVISSGGAPWKRLGRVPGHDSMQLDRSEGCNGLESGNNSLLVKRQLTEDEKTKNNMDVGSDAKCVKRDDDRVVSNDFWNSDHRPIVVELWEEFDRDDNYRSMRSGLFHYETCWAVREDCRELVKPSWVVSGSEGVIGRIKSVVARCTKELASWNLKNCVSMTSAIAEQQKELHRASTFVSSGSWAEIRQIEANLDKLL
ncbi:hypothetical protein Dsin_022320 [Dipteronia sinensis]|uniref:Uncharacterized protein n=1 Tax=Dipteronia sinensis TaxID=43782 RepID=A0AAE0A1Q8_9ROSI|nr:hypothetical protein Dsin_022320 [Dipteronia sinensis]